MCNADLQLQLCTVFIQPLPRTFLLSFGRAGKLFAGWSRWWAHQVAWAEQIVLSGYQAGFSDKLMKKKLKDITCHVGAFSFQG